RSHVPHPTATLVLRSPRRRAHRGQVVVDVPRLAPAPVVTGDRAETLLEVLVNRDAVERFHSDALQRLAVGFTVRADEHETSGRCGAGRCPPLILPAGARGPSHNFAVAANTLLLRGRVAGSLLDE